MLQGVQAYVQAAQKVSEEILQNQIGKPNDVVLMGCVNAATAIIMSAKSVNVTEALSHLIKILEHMRDTEEKSLLEKPPS